ncbi:MAG: hypothetical protein HYZ26_07550 [Chloroflexi bacterium]|nr:hypothetical protein [Chloroflexota bacterium]
MNAIAEEFAPQDVGAIFLYTNEAHPGEHYPHLTSMRQKFEHARALRDIYGVSRPILVDALSGDCHLAYGSMPNMTWIFNSAGAPVYKSDWTDALSVRNAIAYFVDVAGRRREGQRLAPFRVERLDYRTQDREKFYEALERNGPKAVKEFRSAFG